MTDEQVRQILSAPQGETIVALAARMGLRPQKVSDVRRLASKRALRIAEEMNVLPPVRLPDRCYEPSRSLIRAIMAGDA